MGKNNNGTRIGAVKERSQFFNDKTQTWMKRNTETGKLIQGKKDGTPFKGVKKENFSK